MSQKERYQKEIRKKLLVFIKNELGGKTMKEFGGLRAKRYSYLTVDNNENKKAIGTKNVIKRKLKFEDCKIFLQASQLENKINYPAKK